MLTMRGLSDATISERLGIGIGTVRSHQKQLLAKTETRSKAEVAHLLTRIG
jgi:DNA-binding CsgD family transcriptional regulator